MVGSSLCRGLRRSGYVSDGRKSCASENSTPGITDRTKRLHGGPVACIGEPEAVGGFLQTRILRSE